jgi:hypothetical protein
MILLAALLALAPGVGDEWRHKALTTSSLLTTPRAVGLVPVSETPANHATWAAALAAHAGVTDFNLAAGDYRSWGVISPSVDGVYVRYAGASASSHPVDRVGTANEAIIDGWSLNTRTGWGFIGLTIRAPTAESDVLRSSSVVIDECLFEDSVHPYVLRVRASTTVYVQRSVWRDQVPPGGDGIGVQVRPLDGEPCDGIYVLDNECVNATDCFQPTASADLVTAVNNMFVVGNEFGMPSSAYVACAGGYCYAGDNNGFDHKTQALGGFAFYQDNIFHGFRYSTGAGSQGDCGVCQVTCDHTIFERNIFDDCSTGLKMEQQSRDSGVSYITKRNFVRNNLFYNININSSLSNGAVVDVGTTGVIERNWFVASHVTCDIADPALPAGPTWVENRLATTGDSTCRTASSASTWPGGNYEYGRWTGRAWKHLP